MSDNDKRRLRFATDELVRCLLVLNDRDHRNQGQRDQVHEAYEQYRHDGEEDPFKKIHGLALSVAIKLGVHSL